MFKKTLLALALTATTSTAFAATITDGVDILSRQGIATEASITMESASAGLDILLAAEYAVGDIITISVAGATIDTVLSAPLLTAVITPDTADTMTLGLLSSTASTMTFRVTELTYDGTNSETTIGATLTLSGVELDTDSVVASSAVNVTYSAKTSTNIPLDVNDTAAALTVVNQFSSSVTTVLNGEIDVNNDRQQFTNVGPDDATTDTLVITPVDAAAVLPALEAAYTGATYTVKGDFSFLDVDADGVVDAGELTAVTVSTSGDDTTAETLNAAMDELSVVVTAVTDATVEVVDVEFTVAGAGAGNPVLNVQDFTVDSVLAYTDAQAAAATVATASDEVAGSWTINGSQITFPYAPVGYSNITTQFEIANSGTQNGEISVDAFDTAGNDYSAVLPQVAEAGKLTKIGFADLTTAFGLSAGTKLSLTITIAAPAGDIKITGYSNLNNAGRMALLSDAYEGM
jgi:hypothetical protein